MNVKALAKLFKKCASSVRTEKFKRMEEMCTGEYLSRSNHDQIMPDSVTYGMSNSIQYFLSLKRTEPQERPSQTHGSTEKSLLEDSFMKGSGSLSFSTAKKFKINTLQ